VKADDIVCVATGREGRVAAGRLGIVEGSGRTGNDRPREA
jgi:hypothetical protein